MATTKIPNNYLGLYSTRFSFRACATQIFILIIMDVQRASVFEINLDSGIDDAIG